MVSDSHGQCPWDAFQPCTWHQSITLGIQATVYYPKHGLFVHEAALMMVNCVHGACVHMSRHMSTASPPAGNKGSGSLKKLQTTNKIKWPHKMLLLNSKWPRMPSMAQDSRRHARAPAPSPPEPFRKQPQASQLSSILFPHDHK